jgi:translation initiation factor 3 subunit G
VRTHHYPETYLSAIKIYSKLTFLFQNYSRADWADDEEFDDPSALPAQQITANKDGTKTVTSYRFNDDGKKVKVTRRIKTTVVREHVNPQVAERKTWAKFGLEKGHAAGPSFDTTSVGENIVFRPSVNWKAQAAEAEKNGGEKGSIKDQLKDKKVKCRICSGEHFTARCPFKDTMAPVDEGGEGGEGAGGAGGEEAAGGLGVGGGSYVPPHMRKGAAAGGERMAGKYEKDDLATLRVTNVCLPSLLPFPLLFFLLPSNPSSRKSRSSEMSVS